MKTSGFQGLIAESKRKHKSMYSTFRNERLISMCFSLQSPLQEMKCYSGLLIELVSLKPSTFFHDKVLSTI